MKKILFVISVIIISSNEVLAHDLLKNGYDISKVYKYTVEEASKLAKSGNPMDFVIAFKEEQNNKIDYEYFNPLEFEVEDSASSDYNYKMIYKMYDAESLIIDNIKSGTIKQLHYELENTKLTNKNIMIAIVLIAVALVLLIMFLFSHKMLLIVLLAISLSIGVFNFINFNKRDKNSENISTYIMTGKTNEHLSKNIDSKENKDKLMKYMNQKWSIAKLLNDFIVKINWCNNMNLKNIDFTDDTYYMMADEFDSDNPSIKHEYNGISLLKYLNLSNSEFGNDSILRNGLWLENMDMLADRIANGKNDINYISNELMKKFNYNDVNDIKIANEQLFHYLNRIVNNTYVMNNNENIDNRVISYFKDWYIESIDDIEIDLPYDITFCYESPKLVKKDIKEVVYTNEHELDFSSNEKQVLIVYYKDSNGRVNGTYTDIELVKTGDDYIIDFNPYELLYDIKKPTARLVVK